MDGPQEAHLRNVIREFTAKADAKYRKGQAEHGGNLFDVSEIRLVENSLEEAIDLVVYLVTLHNKMVMRGA